MTTTHDAEFVDPPPMYDPATQSNWQDAVTEHSHFDWTVDFDKKLIHGQVTHSILVKQESGLDTVSFDASYITLGDVLLEGHEAPLKVQVHPRHPVMGNKIDVKLPKPVSAGHELKITLNYATTDQCTALGWLEKEQTSDGTHPFVYSQCQAIHARSLFPCQDTPAVKFTYTATARSAQEGCVVLCSARQESTSGTESKYNQPIPLPSYLVAIAGGRLEFADLGPKCGVWAEPSVLKDAKWEFEETQKFLDVGEKLVGPYEWGRYDVLVLPKSFPYGGMENTNLTFLTPTLLAGDRSMVDVIAHEFSHSYFGNLVSCANWCSFWLNEGFTTYTERLIQRELHDERERAFSFIIGRAALAAALEENKNNPKYQRLHIDFDQGEDPDDAFSTVPYDKGSNFLLHLERTVGGLDVFLPYVQDYVKTYRNCSITTDTWKAHLMEYFKQHHSGEVFEKLKAVDFDAWLYGEGLTLPVEMTYDTSLADAAYALAARWDAARHASKLDFSPADLKDFNTMQKVVFLEKLEKSEPLSASLLDEMNKQYAFDSTGSTEVRLRWYNLALKPKSGGNYASSAAEWVADKGRMKFCRPVYRALFGLDKTLAVETFQKNERFYHPIARNMIAKDLKLE